MDRGGLWAKTEDIAQHWGERVNCASQRPNQTRFLSLKNIAQPWGENKHLKDPNTKDF